MTANNKCRQRRNIISLASGVSRREKCGRQAGKENARPCKNISAPHHCAQSSCANTVTDCQPHRQIHAVPEEPRFRIHVAALKKSRELRFTGKLNCCFSKEWCPREASN